MEACCLRINIEKRFNRASGIALCNFAQVSKIAGNFLAFSTSTLIMSVDTILFAITAFIVIASALMVIVNRHPIYSALYLVLTFLGLAGFYLQLSASFIAAVQVIVYAGAIMVLFLFVIMLLGEDKPLPGEGKFGMQKWLGALFALCLVAEIGYLVVRTAPASASGTSTPPQVPTVGSGELTNFGSVQAIGTTLFTDYVFAFEATSVLLLIAMIGVVALAKRRL